MMKGITAIALITAALLMTAPPSWAMEKLGVSYLRSMQEILEHKAPFDDPRPDYGAKAMYEDLPEEVRNLVTVDPDECRREWEKLVGFKVPDVVGKVAPEIKSGTYTLADKEKYPFDKLMPPYWYNKWNEPDEHIANFKEITIIPPKQLYHAVPVSKASLENMGTCKLDDQGYIREDTYKGGIPFPRPQEPHQGWKIIWNHYYFTYLGPWEDLYNPALEIGINSRFRQDYYGFGAAFASKRMGRTYFPPLGWVSEQAQKNQELFAYWLEGITPRDQYGNITYYIVYAPNLKNNLVLYYYNALRRIRKLAPSDGQDQFPNRDYAYDDLGFIAQKLNPNIYPYEIKMIADREFLVPDFAQDGTDYLDSKEKYIWKNFKFWRRPMYVIELKQLDPNYIYSKRVIYFDKELLTPVGTEMYDQKGRLWRTYHAVYGFNYDHAMYFGSGIVNLDHIDKHSTYTRFAWFPAYGLSQDKMSAKALMRAVK